jgi:hypothetical protein
MTKSIFSALMSIDDNEIPVFIPTFNQPSLPAMTLKQFESYRHGPIVVFDNNSTYTPMVDLLEEISSDVQVVKSSRNLGPRFLSEDLQILSLMPKKFIVTDPDLIHNKKLPDNYSDEMMWLLSSLKLTKIGFALDIDSPEEVERFQDVERVHMWEKQYWNEIIGRTSSNDPIYSAWIDTTFSLNDRDECVKNRMLGRETFRYPSARIGGSYTCQHVGWWRKNLIPQPDEEKKFYLDNQKWSHTEIYYYR